MLSGKISKEVKDALKRCAAQVRQIQTPHREGFENSKERDHARTCVENTRSDGMTARDMYALHCSALRT